MEDRGDNGSLGPPPLGDIAFDRRELPLPVCRLDSFADRLSGLERLRAEEVLSFFLEQCSADILEGNEVFFFDLFCRIVDNLPFTTIFCRSCFFMKDE